MLQKSEKIWMDGKFVNWDDASVHILTHTLHYGLGVFEGIRCYELDGGGSAVFRLKEHIKRLYESAHMFTMEIPFPQDEIVRACLELFKVNKLKNGYLRPLVYLGAGDMGLNYKDNPVRVAIANWTWGSYLGDAGIKNGIRGKVSSYTRLATNINLPKGKTCGNYVNSILAKREAVKAGYEEAILLDTEGYVCEASGENVFIVKDGVVKTPPTSSSILKGITRDSAMTLLREQSVTVIEERFGRDEAYVADEMFVTGTAAEICPVRELDDRTIGSGKPGPITQKLQAAFFDAVKGKNPKYENWLARVE